MRKMAQDWRPTRRRAAKHQAILVSPQAESGVHPGQDKQESNNLIADFMSKTISQVSSTLERLTRAARLGKTGKSSFEQSPAVRAGSRAARRKTAARREPRAAKAHPVEQKIGQAPEPVREEPRIDPAILRLVDELDLAIEDAKSFCHAQLPGCCGLRDPDFGRIRQIRPARSFQNGHVRGQGRPPRGFAGRE